MQKLNTINCEEIMTQPLKPIEFVVDNLITQGLFILAGAPKMAEPQEVKETMVESEIKTKITAIA